MTVHCCQNPRTDQVHFFWADEITTFCGQPCDDFYVVGARPTCKTCLQVLGKTELLEQGEAV